MKAEPSPLDLPELKRCSAQAQRGIVAAYKATGHSVRSGNADADIRDHAADECRLAMFGTRATHELPQKVEMYIDGLIAGLRIARATIPNVIAPPAADIVTSDYGQMRRPALEDECIRRGLHVPKTWGAVALRELLKEDDQRRAKAGNNGLPGAIEPPAGDDAGRVSEAVQ